MTREELEQRVRQIDGFIRVLTQECHILDERRHILAPLIQNTEIQAGLKAKLDKVLEDMHNDGTSKAISEKWFGIDISM